MTKTRWITIPLASLSLLLTSFIPANALDITNRSVYVSPSYTRYQCYYDYNWWETYILGKRDGWRWGEACLP